MCEQKSLESVAWLSRASFKGFTVLRRSSETLQQTRVFFKTCQSGTMAKVEMTTMKKVSTHKFPRKSDS